MRDKEDKLFEFKFIVKPSYCQAKRRFVELHWQLKRARENG